MKKCAVIGARGSLGAELSAFLESRNVHVIRVVRNNPRVDEVAFDDFLRTGIEGCDKVFEFALLDFNSMIRLRDNCELARVDLIYMSSVVINQESRWRDSYSKYKFSQYRIYRSYERSEVLYGDLFVNDIGFLGYWKYFSLDGCFVSFRPLSITNTKRFLVADRATISTYKLNKYSVSTFIIPKSFVDLIFLLKLNKLLSVFKINIVK